MANVFSVLEKLKCLILKDNTKNFNSSSNNDEDEDDGMGLGARVPQPQPKKPKPLEPVPEPEPVEEVPQPTYDPLEWFLLDEEEEEEPQHNNLTEDVDEAIREAREQSEKWNREHPGKSSRTQDLGIEP